MNRAEAEAAADALHCALLKIRSKRSGWLVIADHERVLARLVELGETIGRVVAAASELASETFSADAALVARLRGPFDALQVRVSGATGQLLAARKVVRREVLEHRDVAVRRGARRSPWLVSASADCVLGPLTDATTAAWALTRPRSEGDASDLSEHFWLAGGLARMTAEMWLICGAEAGKLGLAYTGVETVRPGKRAQESVSQAGEEWHRAGLVLMETMAVLRRRARDRGTALERPQSLAAAGGGR